MKFLRFAAIGAMLALAAAGATALYAIRHQTQIVRMVLAQIDQRTGLNITIEGARLAFRGRLVVVLENPRVAIGGREIARLADIRATLGYNSIIHRQGLPLILLVLDHPAVTLPPMNPLAPAGGIAQIGPNATAMVARAHDLLSDICRRILVNRAEFADGNGDAIADDVYISAFQRHPRVRESEWDIRFRSRLRDTPIEGVRLAGAIQLGGRTDALSLGRVWFWDLNFNQLGTAGLWMSAPADGLIRYVLHPGAEVSGAVSMNLKGVIAGGGSLNQTIALGSYSLHAAYSAAPARLDISKFTLGGGMSRVIEGSASIADPYSEARTVTFSVGGPSFELTHIPRWLHSVRGAPPGLFAFTERLRSGKFTIAAVSLNTPEPVANLTPATLRDHLNIQATLADASYVPIPELNLPPVNEFDAQLAYSKGIARLTQGSGQIGGSSIADMNITADLRRAPARIPYQAAIAGQIAVGDLYHAAKDALYRAEPRLRRRLAWIHGHAPLTASASGSLSRLTIAPPSKYTIKAELNDIEFEINNAPSAIALKSGAMTLRPGRLSIDRVTAVMLDEKTGGALLNGEAIIGGGAPRLRNFSADLREIDIADWLPLFVDSSQIAAKGLLGGRLVANSDPARGTMPVVTGKLTLGPGSIQPFFLRSPMMVERSATLRLDGKGLAFDMRAGKLEGAQLDFRASIADFDRPAMRIDAKTSRLDLEAMRFIRLPWSPKMPPTSFALPVAGHIEAREGNLQRLAMTDISTDFSHDEKVWRVYNFHATAFNGDARLRISGSSLPSNNWINISGQLDSMDAGPLFALAERQKRSPLTGKLNATADLWANTDVNFFSTLAGNMSMSVANGSLDRFTLLTRILSFIDLKNWLTANFPDPRVSGVPFDTLTADFKGRDGDFYTENLRLEGPVMDIIAKGDIDLANARMDMQVGLVPFNTVSWMMKHIPLIGTNLAGGTEGLIAAYFQVRGPIRDPWILPKPITSVAEFLIKTLSLPINIIKPNTVK